MEWLKILTSQQDDFCQRILSENLLHCDREFLFSELVIVTAKNLDEIRIKCTDIVNKHRSKYPKIDLFSYTLKKELIKYTIKKVYGDLLLSIQEENNNIFEQDYLTFSLKSNHKIKVIVKINYNISSSPYWCFSSEEITNHQILLCLLSARDFVKNQVKEYRLILTGFLPNHLKENLENNSSIEQSTVTLEKLLYCGGLRGYLNSLIPEENYYLDLAKKANHRGDYLMAIVNYNKAIKLNDHNAKSYLFRAISRWKIGDNEGALLDCTESIKLDENNDLAYHWRGYINFKLGNYQEALNDYTEEINLNNLATYAYYRRAFIHEKLHNLLKAFEDYSSTINLNKNLYQAYYNRGNIRYELNDRAGAIEDLTQTLKLNPNLPQAYYNRAIIYVDLGELDSAIKDYEIAIKLMPNYYKAYYNLIILYSDLEQNKKALEYYQELIKFNPDLEILNISKEDLLKYLTREENLNPPSSKVRIRKIAKFSIKKEQIKSEKPIELSPDNMPYNELIIFDGKHIKIEENNKKSLDKKILDPWNTKQY